MGFQIPIVVIDDNRENLELLSIALKHEAATIFVAHDSADGLDLVFSKHPQIVITDLRMPGLDGFEILDRVIAFDPSIDVILMTGHHSSESAVDAIRRGAADYLTKPLQLQGLRERVARLIEEALRREAVVTVDGEILRASSFEGMIGRSAAMWEMFSRIRRIAPHYKTVLVGGDTGSGKELVARALHNLSPVKNGRFVVLNCSAVVESLFESELFGHVRGSFTGAAQDKMGLFEHADKGTLFLDEIGDMPLGTQAKLLRTLQHQEVLRVGSLTPRTVNVRVIAATHRDLRAAIADRRFREDLYYRLSMVEIRTPSLAMRKEDLPLLTRHIVSRFARQFGKEIRGLTQRAQILLARHDWPGNVRELENVLGHGCMMTIDELVDVGDLPEYMQSPLRVAPPGPASAPGDSVTLEAHEKQVIVEALAATNGNQTEAARLLSIGRDALRYKMKKHGLGDVSAQAKSGGR